MIWVANSGRRGSAEIPRGGGWRPRNITNSLFLAALLLSLCAMLWLPTKVLPKQQLGVSQVQATGSASQPYFSKVFFIIGLVSLVFSAKPPAGQLVCFMALGAIRCGQLGTEHAGVLGGGLGASVGLLLGCMAALLWCSHVAPAVAHLCQLSLSA